MEKSSQLETYNKTDSALQERIDYLTKVVKIQADNFQKLEAENARLRKKQEATSSYINKLENENSSLREKHKRMILYFNTLMNE